MLCSLNLGDRDRVVVIWLARAQACLPHAIHWRTQDHRRIAFARIAPRTQVSQGFLILRKTETPQILVRKRGFPVRAEGRGSSAEASPSWKGLRKLKERARKALRSHRSPFAEAALEIEPKNLRGSNRGRRKQKDYKCYSRKDRGRASRKR